MEIKIGPTTRARFRARGEPASELELFDDARLRARAKIRPGRDRARGEPASKLESFDDVADFLEPALVTIMRNEGEDGGEGG